MKLKKALAIACDELQSAYLNEHEHHDRCDKQVKKLSEALDVVEKLSKSVLVDSLDNGPKGTSARASTPAREEGDSPHG